MNSEDQPESSATQGEGCWQGEGPLPNGGLSAYQEALSLLKRQDRFEGELRDMLLARSFEPGDIDAALAYCVKRRLLDDVGLAVRIAEKTTGKRAQSLELLVEKLQRKGASQAALDAVKNHFTEDPQGLLMRFDPARQGDKARAARFLASRGFEENEVESALERYFEPSAESFPDESQPI